MKRPALNIAFIAGGAPFHGASPEQGALGGSETACVQVARALAGRGHRVRVYCRCPAPGLYHGVRYLAMGDLVAAAHAERFDVLVVSRDFAALDLGISAGLKVLWNHDILDKPRELAKRLGKLDLLFVLSRYHGANYTARLPECAPLLVKTKNGLDMGLIDAAHAQARKTPGLLTYVSRPERGLKLLLQEIWPQLTARVPGLTLAVCGYQTHQEIENPWLREEYREIGRLMAGRNDVVNLGALAKAEYYRHLAASQMLIYPCTFPEISCLAALEAQALGTAILTSDSFALSETVRPAACKVSGRPASSEYVQRFLARAVQLLNKPELISTDLQEARQAVRREHDWRTIAAEWEGEFLSRLEARQRQQAPALAVGLAIRGDRAAAGLVLGRQLPPPKEGPTPPDPREDLLLARLTELAEKRLPPDSPARVGVLALDNGRTASALAVALPGADVAQITPGYQGPLLDLLIIRDCLERETKPGGLLRALLPICRENGQLIVLAASGAWPLAAPGHAARLHDLGPAELAALLPGRRLQYSFLPVGGRELEGERYLAARWLVAGPVAGPPPGSLNPEQSILRTRPAPESLVREAVGVGLI